MKLTVKHFSELTAAELHEIYRLRVAVFVVEQNCPYQEVDGKDVDAYHLWLTENGEIIAYLRVLAPGVSYPEVSIGRVISTRRRMGIGTKILEAGIYTAKEKFGTGTIRLEAQTYARKLYENAGFIAVGEEFLEDGIPHIEMLRTE